MSNGMGYAMAIDADQQSHAWSESSIKANAPPSSGVYAICSAVWIYIGESEDIQRRLLDILNGADACISHAVPTVFAFEVYNLTERVPRQATLIARFRPFCNQITATASPSEK